jgi:hypothetical protein
LKRRKHSWGCDGSKCRCWDTGGCCQRQVMCAIVIIPREAEIASIQSKTIIVRVAVKRDNLIGSFHVLFSTSLLCRYIFTHDCSTVLPRVEMTLAMLNLLIAFRQTILQRASILFALFNFWCRSFFFDDCGLPSHHRHLHGEALVFQINGMKKIKIAIIQSVTVSMAVTR